MAVATLAMNDFAEEALPDHVEDSHHVSEVAVVFQAHGWDTGLFIGVYQFPTLV
jgi:hypothetical protein